LTIPLRPDLIAATVGIYQFLHNQSRVIYNESSPMNKIFLLLILVTSLFVNVFPANAQQPPTPTPTPYIGKANCDVCGYCEGAILPGRWQDCRRCLYRGFGEGDIDPSSNSTLIGLPTPDPEHFYTDFGCISTLPGEFATAVSSFFFSIIGGIAFLFFLYGAGVVATSRSDPARLNYGKRIIYGAIIGLLFALFSVFILRVISTGLGLPGFG